jgi:hypothetical protein
LRTLVRELEQRVEVIHETALGLACRAQTSFRTPVNFRPAPVKGKLLGSNVIGL